ncbi:MAG: tetratricopeptide repeat protein, partial [Gemmatimonadota bacterium]
ALGADRFVREIKITAQLSHPHILTLLDSGTASGFLYYVTPFVAGESLRERIDREKQLPIEDALQITREVADALGSAHSRGIVHRDIKPENILLEEGHAVVADFGIARAVSAAAGERLTDTGLSVGTPGYMSPEQASGQEIDGRSDVYSLGCVIYEMLGGDPPYHGSTPQAILARKITEPVPPLRNVRETVPEALEEAIERALAKVPADRFATATEFRDALAREEVTRSGVRRPIVPRGRLLWRFATAVAAVVGLVVVGLVVAVRSSEGSIDFEERDWILIADPENNTGDDVFDRSLLHAVGVALDQSQYVNVYPRNRVREVLLRMQRDSVPQIDTELAFEIAERENIKAVLGLTISELGGSYLLSTSLLDPSTGATVRSRQAEAAGKHQVLDVLDELATGVRQDLGESLRQIQQRAVPLPAATTSSLEALKLYADGSVAWSQSRWQEARSLWTRAVELDSGFAWANASLGLAVGWLEDAQAAQIHYDRALSQLDRVTEKERLWISALAAPTQEAVDAYQTYLQQYPDDADGWYNLGNTLRFVGRTEEAMEAYQRSLAIDSMRSWVHINLGVGYDALGRFEDAATHFEKSFAMDSAGTTNWRGDVNRISGFVLVKMGDTARARERFELLLSGDESSRANGLRSLALLEMCSGRHASAVGVLEEAIVLNQQAGAALSEYRNRMYLAQAYSSKGMSAELAEQLTVGETLARQGGWGADWTIHLARHLVGAGDTRRAREWLDSWIRSGAEDGDLRWIVELVKGEITLAEGNPSDAVTALERADRSRLSPNGLVKEALGRAYHASGQLEQSAAAFQEAISLKQLGWEAQEPWVLAHYRLGIVLHEMGEAERARSYLERFLELWGSGDDDLIGLADARRRLAGTE